MERVSLRKCESYDKTDVEGAIAALFDDFYGDELFKAGETILVKANLLNNFKEETAATTNPAVIEAICKRLKALGCEVVIGDSSAGFFNLKHLESVYKATGIDRAAKNSDAKLNDDFSTKEIVFNEGKIGKRFDIVGMAEKVDGIVNVAKLKTHQFTMYTGCAKNMFGLIPGMQKVQKHAEYRDVVKFTDFIIDINEYIKPKTRLNVIDAVIAMEGNGPSAGDPKKLGLVIGSKNPYAADVVGVTVIGGKTENFPLFYALKRRGITPFSLSDVEVVGEDLEKNVCKNFRLVRDEKLWCKEGNKSVFSILYPIKKFIAPYPHVPKTKCRGCGVCAAHCPNKAITLKDGKATFDLDKCIRCFCCQELCPYHAIKIKRRLSTKVIEKI